MNGIGIEPERWPPARRWSWIALVFAAQVGLIFALGDRRPVAPRPPALDLVVRVAPVWDELLSLQDAALFALPQRRGFAGAAWLGMPRMEFPPFRWTEPARLLPLRLEALGAAFARFMLTNRFVNLAFESRPSPELPPPVALEIGAPAPTHSTLRVTGDLLSRRLLNSPALPSLAAVDLVTNSVVQVLVNAEGWVISPTLLPPGSGVLGADQRAADQRALELAWSVRFEPQRGTAPPLSVGVLLFEWHTPPPTNAPVAQP